MDNNDFLKKIVIPDLEISECTEHEVKSKIENICQWKKYSNNIWFQFMKLILIFMSITEKKIQVDENGWKYILLRIDVCFIS